MQNQLVYKIFSKNTRKSSCKNCLYRYFLEVFETSRIYLSNPTDFNDPYDIRMGYDFDGATKSDLEEFFGNWPKWSQKSEKDKSEFINTIIGDPTYGSRLFENNETNQNRLRNQTGVFCLTKRIDDLLMWGHYGSNHSGVAIGFNSSILINQVDGVFRPVRYRKKQPSIKLANKIYRSANENKDHIQKMMLLHLFRKACFWSYEKEARLVKFQTDQFTSESRKIDIPISAIESVYFGSCMPEDDKHNINLAAEIFYFGLEKG